MLLFGNGQLEAIDEPEIAGLLGLQLCFDALRPNLVFAADVKEDAAVARFGRPAPLHAENIIAIFLLGQQVAHRQALAMNDAVADRPGLGRVGVVLQILGPAGEIRAVKELDEALIGGGHGGDEQSSEQAADEFASEHGPSPS